MRFGSLVPSRSRASRRSMASAVANQGERSLNETSRIVSSAVPFTYLFFIFFLLISVSYFRVKKKKRWARKKKLPGKFCVVHGESHRVVHNFIDLLNGIPREPVGLDKKQQHRSIRIEWNWRGEILMKDREEKNERIDQVLFCPDVNIYKEKKKRKDGSAIWISVSRSKVAVKRSVRLGKKNHVVYLWRENGREHSASRSSSENRFLTFKRQRWDIENL